MKQQTNIKEDVYLCLSWKIRQKKINLKETRTPKDWNKTLLYGTHSFSYVWWKICLISVMTCLTGNDLYINRKSEFTCDIINLCFARLCWGHGTIDTLFLEGTWYQICPTPPERTWDQRPGRDLAPEMYPLPPVDFVGMWYLELVSPLRNPGSATKFPWYGYWIGHLLWTDIEKDPISVDV